MNAIEVVVNISAARYVEDPELVEDLRDVEALRAGAFRLDEPPLRWDLVGEYGFNDEDGAEQVALVYRAEATPGPVFPESSRYAAGPAQSRWLTMEN